MGGYGIIQVVRDAVTGKLKLADRNTTQQRRDICNQCELRNTKTNTCTICGCYLRWKTRLSDASCPMELW